jgi:glycosyltransferase involved in cell wall biosynthesis
MAGSSTAAKVSVVIPVKDDALHLETCLEALCRQTTPADEIVVVDNGSTDLTPIVAGWWRVRYVAEPQPGIAAAASTGYDAATGGIIARLDADSIPPTDWIERIRTTLHADAGLSAVTGPGTFDSLPMPLMRIADIAYMQAYFVLFGALVGHPPLFGSNFAMVRSAWDSARLRTHRADARVHDDLDLSFGLDADARVALDPTLRVPVSSRPFTDPVAFARRTSRGIHTVVVNRRSVALPGRPRAAPE